MKPFFFQINQQQLPEIVPQDVDKSYPVSEMDRCTCYGVFHEPTTHFVADHAVLFLYPWGQEYVRSHRGIRRIAMELQEKGVPSLRFDYRGTGDSGGSDQMFSLETSIEDARAAFKWLLETTGARQVKVFAVRLGALIALNALQNFKELKEIVCWDPVLNGQSYLNELYGPHITSRIQKGEVTWINGYPLSRRLQQQLAVIQACTEIHALIVIYGTPDSDAFKHWIADRRAAGLPVLIEHAQPADSLGEWGTVNAIGGFVNPMEILNTALARLIQQGNQQ